MNTELRKRFDEAVSLKAKREFDDARLLLLQLHEESPETASILAVLADVCWDMGCLEEAVSHFRKGTELKPTSEALSLGLFHSLWDSGLEDDAFAEMKRFLANSQSEEYSRLLTEINSRRQERNSEE